MLSHINMPDAGSPTGKIEVLHFPPKKKKKGSRNYASNFFIDYLYILEPKS